MLSTLWLCYWLVNNHAVLLSTRLQKKGLRFIVHGSFDTISIVLSFDLGVKTLK